jgi:hypothetical protein
MDDKYKEIFPTKPNEVFLEFALDENDPSRAMLRSSIGVYDVWDLDTDTPKRFMWCAKPQRAMASGR